MRFDLGTLDSGERSLPFGLLVHSYLKEMKKINIQFLNGLRKFFCLRKIVSLTSNLALVCRMKISGAWHAFYAIADMEWVHMLVTIATSRTFKFIQKLPVLWSYQAIKVWLLQLLWQHSCDVIPFLHEMHAMLLRIPSCIPVLILKSQRLKFSQTNNFSQINKFFVAGGYCCPASTWYDKGILTFHPLICLVPIKIHYNVHPWINS